MSKKSATKRNENKKEFRKGLVKARERFLKKKFELMETVLSDEKKKEELLAKPLNELDQVEMSVLSSLNMKPMTLDEFTEKKEELMKEQLVSAQHKYAVK